MYSQEQPAWRPAGVTMRREYIPPNNAGVRRTLEVMRGLATSPERATQAEAAALLEAAGGSLNRFPLTLREFLDRAWIYEDDPPGVETVRSPGFLLETADAAGMIRGDCDDAATLAAGLAVAVGLRGRFVVLAFDPMANYSHVYAEVLAPGPPGVWYNMDVTRPPGPVATPTAEMVVHFP